MPNRFPPRLSAAGYAPVPEPEVVRTSFSPLGPNWFRDASNLSFPSADPEVGELVPRGTGDLCRHCFKLPQDHLGNPSAERGYEPIGGNTPPGVHPDTTDGLTRNSADVLAESKNVAFHGAAGR